MNDSLSVTGPRSVVTTLINGLPFVLDYPESRENPENYLLNTVGLLDLSGRSRLFLSGTDAKRFLHGQVTNDINRLNHGQGCYAALVTAKGKMQSDLYIYQMEEGLLLDFEPGYSSTVQERLEKYIIAEDVQITNLAEHYALFSLQGPEAEKAFTTLGANLPQKYLEHLKLNHPVMGECYLMAHPRTKVPGFDLFVPAERRNQTWDYLLQVIRPFKGLPVGWRGLELCRIMAGIPRFGQDLDESNLAPESNRTHEMISYNKGCYIGQEVIARIRTYGQVAKSLRMMLLPDSLLQLPPKGTRLLKEDKEVGWITSAAALPGKSARALGFVRKECNQPGTGLTFNLDLKSHPIIIAEA
ncbi:MAG: hypothetical protein SFY81_15980 [Verrucomicrobiota bacterium]|nr:hypothetical protein [Verrucomicrobiota bacterium]